LSSLNDVQEDVALIGTRGDVEKRELIGALSVVARGHLDWVAGIAQRYEVDALHHPACGNVQAGDDALGEAHG
jgi:hypothetical protein